MKTTKQLLMSALLLSASLLVAQTSDKAATVRMKKTTVINGVEKTTDTTFTTNDPASIQAEGGQVEVQEITDKNGKVKKIVIVNDEVTGEGKDGNANVIIINRDEKMTPEEETKLMKIKDGMTTTFIINDDKDGKSAPREGQQFMIKRVGKCGATQAEIDSVKEVMIITIVKRINITDANENEIKQFGKQTGISDQKLAIDKIKFYPNPNNGKFNLAFSLPKKGNTDITIFNIEGKTIYSEKLTNFSGNYDKEIDISQNPKGNYFIKIAQGSASQVKKIVIE